MEAIYDFIFFKPSLDWLTFVYKRSVVEFVALSGLPKEDLPFEYDEDRAKDEEDIVYISRRCIEIVKVAVYCELKSKKQPTKIILNAIGRVSNKYITVTAYNITEYLQTKRMYHESIDPVETTPTKSTTSTSFRKMNSPGYQFVDETLDATNPIKMKNLTKTCRRLRNKSRSCKRSCKLRRNCVPIIKKCLTPQLNLVTMKA